METSAFARRIEAGNFAGAARAVREWNPFSSVCGAICPAERFCEKHCHRLDFDKKPVRIRDLHGWVCNHVRGPQGWDRSAAPWNGCRVAVVGAGPAGLTCAHFLARLGYRVEVMEKTERPGGIPANAIPSFRLPGSVLDRDIQGMTVPGIHLRFGKALGQDILLSDLERDYHAVFLAPGLGTSKGLKIPDLDRSVATDALEYLEDCRNHEKTGTGHRVLVIGGGSVASDAALSAKRFGASEVTLVCLERRDEMPCLKSEYQEMKRNGIRIENRWGPRAAVAPSRLSFAGCRSVFDEAGEFNPTFDESKTMELEFDRLITAVGQTLNPSLVNALRKEMGDGDTIQVHKSNLRVLGRERVFAGGDIVRGPATVVEAVADGRRAAMAIHQTLREDPPFQAHDRKTSIRP